MNLGLKLWSINTDFYLEEAKKLYLQGVYDYIELYVVPNTLSTLPKWSILKNEFNIKFNLHAPHFMHNVNLADKSREKYNIEIFKQVGEYFNELNANYIIVHSGIDGNIDETIRQLKIVKPKNMLIENKPYIAPKGENLKCRGADINEIKKVINETHCGFCLDVGHAICTANSLKLQPYEFLTQFNELNPICYHLSDNLINSELDSHMHFGQGNYNFKEIFDIISLDKNIAIETNKISKTNLDDFIEDIKYIRKLIIE